MLKRASPRKRKKGGKSQLAKRKVSRLFKRKLKEEAEGESGTRNRMAKLKKTIQTVKANHGKGPRHRKTQ